LDGGVRLFIFKKGWLALAILIVASANIFAQAPAWAGPATHFSVVAPPTAQSGFAFSFTVTALDASNAVDTGYSGTVHFTSSSANAVLPANSTLTNGVGTFSATLSFTGPQFIMATDVATSSITGTSGPIVVSGSADLSITKTDGLITVTPGQITTYAIVVQNNGPNAAANVVVTDLLPPTLLFVNLVAPPGWTVTTPAPGSTGTVTATNTSLAPGPLATFQLTVQVSPAAAGNIVNSATVSTATLDTNPGNDTATDINTANPPSADLAVTKVGPASAVQGQNATYTITVSNGGPSAAPSVALTDTLPANMTFVSLSAPVGWTTTTPAVGSTGVVTATNPSLAPSAIATFTLVAKVDAAAAGTISNTATVSSAASDPTAANNSSTTTLNVTPLSSTADLSITKTGPASVQKGQTVTYTLTASNAGPAAATSVTISDALPAGLTFASLTVAAGWACTTPAVGTNGTVNCTNASFSNAASAPFTLIANVTNSAPASVSNTATISSATPDINGANNSATVTTSVTSTTTTTTTLTSSLNPSELGKPVTFTATVTGGNGTPTGTVTFNDGGVAIGTATLVNGITSFTTSSLSLGSHAITASYGGAGNLSPSTSATLTQVVNTPADSLRLRALQVLVTPTVAQVSGQAISGAIDSAIGEAFNGGGAFISPSGGGVRFNFAADPEARAATDSPRFTDPFTSANGSFATNARGFGSHPASSPRLDETFNALGYAGPTKAPPLRVAEPREWLGWAEVRGATLDRWGNLSTVPGATVLYGNQVNVLAGLTRKFTPNFLVGVLGGYETFDYRSDALLGRLKGDGWTVGSYLGWIITQGIRFDAGVAYSGIGYDGTAGTAAGSFNGNRWLVTGGLTGIYNSFGVRIEPSARVYALWEHENAYTDTLGTLQTARDFSTGRASGGVKLSYPVPWSAAATVAPYVGLYGDYYFNSDTAGAPAVGAIPFIVLDGWSTRAVGGLTAQFGNGAQVAIGGERSGIGGNFGLWTYRARASMPFGAQ
jgi:uncharacterized repeat protein (TIGR01451 family)